MRISIIKGAIYFPFSIKNTRFMDCSKSRNTDNIQDDIEDILNLKIVIVNFFFVLDFKTTLEIAVAHSSERVLNSGTKQVARQYAFIIMPM